MASFSGVLSVAPGLRRDACQRPAGRGTEAAQRRGGGAAAMLAQPLRGAVIAHGQLARGCGQVIEQWADLCSPSRNVVSKMISFSVAPAEKHLVGTGTRRCTLRACRTAERIISGSSCD